MAIRSRLIPVFLLTTCMAVAVASAQDPPSRWRTGAQKPVNRPPEAQPVEAPPGATIKRLGIGGPVTGGQTSFGLVELTEPAGANGVTVQLSSGDPAIVVPPTVKVEPGAADASFSVGTTPVAQPATITVSARTSVTAAPQTATVTVRPPSLSFISCTPQTVPSGTPTTCQVQLDGPVASSAEAVAMTLASSNTAVAIVAQETARIGPGERSASFTVTTKPLAQSSWSEISASYGGVTRATKIQVQPVAIASVACGNFSSTTATGCEYTPQPGRNTPANVKLTAPAPPGGLVVKLSDSPNLLTFGDGSGHEVDSIRIPASQSGYEFEIHSLTVRVDTRVTVSASAPLTGETSTFVLTVKAPVVMRLRFTGGPFQPGNPLAIAGVPVGGRTVSMYVDLNGEAPIKGLPVELKYGGSTDIKGPALVRVPHGRVGVPFQVTVGPCSLGPECEVFVITGRIQAKLLVRP